MTKLSHEKNEFPGRWLGGISLIIGPLFMLLGCILRFKFNFFFPDQLLAYHEHPKLIVASYNIFIAGNILLWPAVIVLAKMISLSKPRWAFFGGIFTIFGLFARTFHAGIDHLAFQLVRDQNVDLATNVISNTYSAFHIFKTFNLAIMLGWVVLAIGAYLAKVLNIYLCIALALMSTLPLGVLKGSTAFSLIATIGLAIALIPLGLRIIREGHRPSAKKIFAGVTLAFVMIALFYFFGQAG